MSMRAKDKYNSKLTGPKPFPLERLLAIFYNITEVSIIWDMIWQMLYIKMTKNKNIAKRKKTLIFSLFQKKCFLSSLVKRLYNRETMRGKGFHDWLQFLRFFMIGWDDWIIYLGKWWLSIAILHKKSHYLFLYGKISCVIMVFLLH